MPVAQNSLFAQHKVDPSKPLPFHIQVYHALELIIQNDLTSGDQLPGEPKLCELFGVSRTVIRQAMDHLLRDGRIVRIIGKGTFVAESKIHEGIVARLTGFYEDMVEKGYTPVSRLLKLESSAAGTTVARKLGLDVGASVIELRRLRFVNEVPIQIVSSYLPYSLCPNVLQTDFTFGSLYAYLSDVYDLHISSGKRTIEAVLATTEEAKLLDIATGSPLILLDSVSYLRDGTALEYYRAVHRSDRARFEVNLIRVAD